MLLIKASFKEEIKMKLSIFTVATPDMTPDRLAAAAQSAGLEGIEWRYKEVPQSIKGDKPSFWGNNLSTIAPSGEDEQITYFRQLTEQYGLTTLSLTPYLTAGDVQGTEEVLQAAKKLGAKYIRLGSTAYDRSRTHNELFEQTVTYLTNVEPLCKQYGIKGLIETHHGTITASASAARQAVNSLNPEYVGILYDPGNMVYEGYENYRMGMEILGPYLAHVHVKNAGWTSTKEHETDGSVKWKTDWMPMKQGMVPWKLILDDLKFVGYDGYLGLEDFSLQYSSPEMLHQFADYMKSLLEN
jgi:sugar phosphate isomerase/epimerase